MAKNRSTTFFFFDCDTEYMNMREILARDGIAAESFSWIHSTEREPLKNLSRRLEAAGACGKAVLLFRLEMAVPELEDFFRGLGKTALLIPLGPEAVTLRVHSIEGIDVENINRYVINGGSENILRAAAYIRKKLLGESDILEPLPPAEKPFDGIFSTVSDETWPSLAEYLAATGKNFPAYVGWLIDRHNWNREDFAEAAIAEEAFARRNIGLIPVFSNSNQNCLSFSEIVERYLSLDGRLAIDALINGQLFAVRAQAGRSVFEQTAFEYKKLDIPVINPIHSFHLTEEEWRSGGSPLSLDMPTAYITPEATGMTEPVIISARSEDGMKSAVMPEMVDYLCGRTAKWVALRRKKNSEKKLTVMLHSSVCSGVEATIGKAYGLDAFESTCRLVRALKEEGYNVGDFPETGEALFRVFMGKKAFADFRWTAVEDIAEHGGCLYRMDTEGEYMKYYGALPEKLRRSMEETWGAPPGEGMVIGKDIIITGVAFGNVTVMIQPKRGCYGAKCTGEVCRILHDPSCPPPHQYLAVYRYMEDILGADACVEIGTEGSLEFLPGKSNAPSLRCWTYVVLGELPLIYVYNAGVPSEAMVAKRRTNALTVGHLPPACGGSTEGALLAYRIDEYFKAIEIGNGQETALLEEIKELLAKIPGAEQLASEASNIEDGLRLAADALKKNIDDGRICERHILGVPPTEDEAVRYIKEVWRSEEGGEEPSVKGACAHDLEMTQTIREGLAGGGEHGRDARELYAKLRECGRETAAVVRALSGRYIEPGEAGMPDYNGRGILPTGGSLHASDTSKIPTRTAYMRGVKMAEELISAYIRDEGRMPRKVAMNMISLDITKTGGEQLSQFLHLLGVRPLWDAKEKFRGLEAIPLSELGRPRIDVTVRISGVLRDTWPFAVKIMDDAVLLSASLGESEEDNYVIGHINDFTGGDPSAGIREASVRIFGDAPGSYGAGIDLALMASAWEDEKDLAEYFIQASAFAYGDKLDGKTSVREFIDNMKRVDLSSDTSVCKRMDSISCGFGIQVHGGIRLTAKLLGKRDIRQYQSLSERGKEVETTALNESVERDINATLLNPLWRESRKEEGRDGASDIMHLMQNIFAAQCACKPLDDRILDELTETYINNKDMRDWMLAENPFAAEESARRMLELHSREKWRPSPDVLSRLKESYLLIEGEMEGMTESRGDIQGGAVEKINHTQVENWRRSLTEIEKIIEENAAKQ